MVLLTGGSYREAVLGTLFSLTNESLNAWSTVCGFCFITCLYIYSMCAASSVLLFSALLLACSLCNCSNACSQKLDAQHHAEAFMTIPCLPERLSECCRWSPLHTDLLHSGSGPHTLRI